MANEAETPKDNAGVAAWAAWHRRRNELETARWGRSQTAPLGEAELRARLDVPLGEQADEDD